MPLSGLWVASLTSSLLTPREKLISYLVACVCDGVYVGWQSRAKACYQ